MALPKSGERIGWVRGVRRQLTGGWRFVMDEQGNEVELTAKALRTAYLTHPVATTWQDAVSGSCELDSLTPTALEPLEDIERDWFGRVYSEGQDVLVYCEPRKCSRKLRNGISRFLIPAAFAVHRFMCVELNHPELVFTHDPLGVAASPDGDNGYVVNPLVDRTRAHLMRRLAALGVERPDIRRAYASFFQGATAMQRLTMRLPEVAGYIRGIWLRNADSALLATGEILPSWPETALVAHRASELAS